MVLNDWVIEADTTLPEAAAEALRLLGKEVDRLETRLAEIDKNLLAQHKADPDSRRLSAIPGVGPMSALNFSRMVDATQFKSGRHFAAWLGLVPREISTGGLAEPQVIDDFDRSARTKSFCSSDSGAEISFHDPVDSLHAIWSRLIKRETAPAAGQRREPSLLSGCAMGGTAAGSAELSYPGIYRSERTVQFDKFRSSMDKFLLWNQCFAKVAFGS